MEHNSQNKNDSWLTVSDWIAYLSSEKRMTTGILLSVSALVVALIALVFSTEENGWPEVLGDLIACIALVFVLWKVLFGYGKRAENANDTLNRIIKGDLKSELDIREEWKKLNPKDFKK